MSDIPVDDSWRAARTALLAAAPGHDQLRDIFPAIFELSPDRQLDRINKWVNWRISFVDDLDRLGVADHWATPRETLNAGKGDCEDYAILKMQLLRAAGFPLKDMRILIIEEPGPKYHAMLMVEMGGDVRILDNRTNETRQTIPAMRAARFALGVDDQFKLHSGVRSSRTRSGLAVMLDKIPDFVVTTG